LWRNKVLESKNGLSDKWLLFKSEKNRDEYREQNIPKYSEKEVETIKNIIGILEELERPINIDFKHGAFSTNPYRFE